jgi:pimeloyl-ACP methyl ester carboxylesterase
VYKGLSVAMLAAAVVLAGTPAEAAPLEDGLGGYYRQQLAWQTCRQNESDEVGTALDAAGARCAPVRVPIDYAWPAGGSLTVWISRVAATDTAHRIGPLVINLGGPGISTLGSVLDAAAAMGATGARFDLIGMDVRFTGRSTPVDCGWPSTWIPRSAGASRGSFDQMVALSAELATRCTTRYGTSLLHASTENAARDLDIVRAALGDRGLSYLGYSYGSYLGALYMQLFARHADRMVLDSAIDPADPGVHLHGDDGPARTAALNAWAVWVAGRDAVYHLGATAAEVTALIDTIYRAAADRPLRIGQYQVDETVVPALLVNPLSDDSGASNDQLARFVRTLADALTGAPVEPAPDLADVLAGILTGANSVFHSGQTAISCADEPVSRDIEWYRRDTRARQARAPLFGGLNRISPCVFWPTTPPRPRVIDNAVPALIVHADGDINATPELNEAMHRALHGSRMITLDHVRTHGVYLFRGAACVDESVNAYLNTGVLPGGDQRCTE